MRERMDISLILYNASYLGRSVSVNDHTIVPNQPKTATISKTVYCDYCVTIRGSANNEMCFTLLLRSDSTNKLASFPPNIFNVEAS